LSDTNDPIVAIKRSFASRLWRIHGQSGASLIIVLIMLGVIALTSAATLRNAISNERVSHNFRMHLLAQQYAEAGLRYCERQLTLTDASSIEGLKESNLFAASGSVTPAWRKRGNWNGSGVDSASRMTVPEAVVVSSESAFKPGKLPDCLVEKQTLESGAVYVITARGFSSDYTADARGFTATGSVVWLQTLAVTQRSAVTDPLQDPQPSTLTLEDRTWRRILNPPIF
jgi:Tfp pilus assembly protein PilX